jgi:hypothetical protein
LSNPLFSWTRKSYSDFEHSGDEEEEVFELFKDRQIFRYEAQSQKFSKSMTILDYVNDLGFSPIILSIGDHEEIAENADLEYLRVFDLVNRVNNTSIILT